MLNKLNTIPLEKTSKTTLSAFIKLLEKRKTEVFCLKINKQDPRRLRRDPKQPSNLLFIDLTYLPGRS